ncbi:pentatricopeptide repeat-containing protein At5g10690 isoform X1 [Brachypodium distachyon]|uniref:pentatricopeptide repeat-containing protein At5g10690 isoform X1 n=1 Tax=Brachypodium distachyon TaxID=15368 RepID=UPI000D0CB5D2|nr:pentatricopeptide repeat-containing protein At5g10690 isoform X1 [Brachypodium distachyon]|eukprot:XP_024318965.1 pentatricopeptide repeat-containing protein At5g10690 isoform X1 [Brachypodium distachyon]
MMLIGPRFLSSSSPPSSTRHETLLPALSTPPEPCRILSSYSPDGPTARRGRTASSSKRPPPDLRRLTARIVDLTRRRQLDQVMAEVEASKRRARAGRGGGINIIVMNAVLEACVSCGDVDLAVQLFEDMRGPRGCGADGVSYGILLKGLGIARRIDEAFEILESIEKDASVGSPKLTPHLICGFLNALIEAGDMRRANALVARFRQVLYKGHSVLLYNLLMKGYIKSNFPLGALTVKDEILRQGLKPDRLTYNTIIFACVKASEIDKAFRFLEDMKDEAKRGDNPELLPDAVTYTTLLKGLGNSQDLYSVLKIVVEMKSSLISIDRTAYTAMADAFLACGSIDGALCIFGELIKQAGSNNDLRPKPHLYLSIMRAFASIGDFDMVKRLNKRMWPDSVGSISSSAKQEAVELLMEAAINNNQIDVARRLLRRIVNEKVYFSWTSRVGLIILNDPVEKYMIPFHESRPLCADLILENVVMRFWKDSAVPLVNDWGSCVGIVHSHDCTKMDAPLVSMARPPLCVPASTSLKHVIDLLLREKSEMVVLVKNGNMYEGSYTSSSRPLGVFSLAFLSKYGAMHETSMTSESPG